MRFVEIYQSAFQDIGAALSKLHLASTMARQDISTRYKRSRIGAFWITIGMAISIGCIGLVFGQILQIPLPEFLPFFTIGTIIWGLVSNCLNEGCGAFVSSSGIIL